MKLLCIHEKFHDGDFKFFFAREQDGDCEDPFSISRALPRVILWFKSPKDSRRLLSRLYWWHKNEFKDTNSQGLVYQPVQSFKCQEATLLKRGMKF